MRASAAQQQAMSSTKHLIKSAQGSSKYDPRFLVFEFTWNLVLRSRQVALVRDILEATARGGGGACVKQMLMGGGKTTVVSPLLCLMLGDGARLVLQVVPPALLEFSRGVMRSTFNSVITKPVVTLDVDRNTLVDARTVEKLRGAIASSARHWSMFSMHLPRSACGSRGRSQSASASTASPSMIARLTPWRRSIVSSALITRAMLAQWCAYCSR